MIQDQILVDIMQTVVDAMRVPNITGGGYMTMNYEPGRSIQIIKSLNENDNSITYKGLKYPLIAMILPVREKMGTGLGSVVRIDRLVIATLTTGTDAIKRRYESDGTFKTVLYPCYREFLKQLAYSKYTLMGDPEAIPHTKMDNPGTQPVGQGSNDFIDSIELLNLEFTLNKIKTC